MRMLSAVLCLILALLVAQPAEAVTYGAYGIVTGGIVITRTDIYNPTGARREIQLWAALGSGGYWAIYCRRSETNLDLCDPYEPGETISAAGVVFGFDGFPGYHWLSPEATSP